MLSSCIKSDDQDPSALGILSDSGESAVHRMCRNGPRNGGKATPDGHTASSCRLPTRPANGFTARTEWIRASLDR